MKNLLLILFISIIFASCEKENEFVLGGSYKLASTFSAGKVRMYTSNGEVTDEATIRKFLKREPGSDSQPPIDFTNYFSFDKFSGSIGDDFYLDITFKQDKAVMRTNLRTFRNDTSHEVDLFKQGDLIVLSEKEVKTDIPVESIEELFETNGLLKVKTYSHCLGNFSECYPGRINIPLLVRNRQVVLPFFAYAYGRYTSHPEAYHAQSTLYNIINTDFLTHLPASDTIVVQEGWVIMEKQ